MNKPSVTTAFDVVDVIIIGGGFVGQAIAIALAKLSLIVVIVETSLQPRQDNRSIALNYNSQQFLDTLQVWQMIKAFSIAIETLHVSEKGRFNKLRFCARQYKIPALGYVVLATKLLDALRQVANSYSNIYYWQPAQLLALNHPRRMANILVGNAKKTLHYQLIIAADGSFSKTREALNIKATISPQRYSALLANLKVQKEGYHAYQRFTSDGTLAMLPLGMAQYKLVVTASNDKIDQWQSQSDREFLIKLQREFGYFLGKLTDLSHRSVYLLHEVESWHQVIDGAVILGNAAHTFFPVAAQSLNLSLQDVACLAQVIAHAKKFKQDFTTLAVLRDYYHKRHSHQQSIKKLTQLLAKALDQDNMVKTLIRQFILFSCQFCPHWHHYLVWRFIATDASIIN